MTTPEQDRPPVPGIDVAVAPEPNHPSGVPVALVRFGTAASGVSLSVVNGTLQVTFAVDARQAEQFAAMVAGAVMQAAQAALAAKPQIVTPGAPGFPVVPGLNGLNPHEVLRQTRRRP